MLAVCVVEISVISSPGLGSGSDEGAANAPVELLSVVWLFLVYGTELVPLITGLSVCAGTVDLLSNQNASMVSATTNKSPKRYFVVIILVYRIGLVVIRHQIL